MPYRAAGMRATLAALVLFLFAVAPVRAQAPTWAWVQSFGQYHLTRPGDSFRMEIRHAVPDSSGGAYVVGTFSDSLRLGSLPPLLGGARKKGFVGHVNGAGVWQWVQAIGGTGYNAMVALTVAPGGDVLLAGTCYPGTLVFDTTTLHTTAFATTAFVARLSAAGRWQWAVLANHAQPFGLATDGAGTIYVAGSAEGQAEFGSLRTSSGLVNPVFMARLSPTGQWIGLSQVPFYPTSPSGYVITSAELAVAADGTAYLAGYFDGRLLFDNITLVSTTPATQFDGYVACRAPTGQWRWAKQLRNQSSYGYFIKPVLDGQGNLYVAGYGSSTAVFDQTPLPSTNGSLLVSQLNPTTGGIITVNQVMDASPASMAIDSTDHLLLGCNFAGTTQFGTTTVTSNPTVGGAAVVARLQTQTQTQTWEWVKVLMTDTISAHPVVVPTGTGDVLVTGTSFGTLLLDQLPIPSPAPSTKYGFLARLTNIANGLPDEDASPTAFSLAPNPAHHTVRLTGGTGPAEVVDAVGRTVRTADLSPDTVTLDLTGLTPGLYVVRRGGVARRLVVE